MVIGLCTNSITITIIKRMQMIEIRINVSHFNTFGWMCRILEFLYLKNKGDRDNIHNICAQKYLDLVRMTFISIYTRCNSIYIGRCPQRKSSVTLFWESVRLLIYGRSVKIYTKNGVKRNVISHDLLNVQFLKFQALKRRPDFASR